MVKIPGNLRKYFWDVHPDQINPQDHKVFIIEQLLNIGDQDSVTWLFRMYGPGEIKEAVKFSRGLSPKTADCWKYHFRLKEEEMLCTGPLWATEVPSSNK